MKKNLVIMLVDDNKIDLFIHNEVIKRISLVKKTQQFSFATDALAYLAESDAQNWPHVILLDIHMPIMNGFDFMIRFEKLEASFRKQCKVVMVSSTLDNEDLKKAKANPEVFAFLEKPLNIDLLSNLLFTIA